jgi:hypothetical protein
MTTLQSVTGQHISMEFKSKGKPSAENKHLQLEKVVKGAFRAGIAFENLTQVKEAIAAGERGEVEELPWGEWKQYPYHITHKGKDYVRFYPSTGGFIQKPSVQYFVNGEETTREEYLSLLPPSARVSKEKECFVVESENILKLGKE